MRLNTDHKPMLLRVSNTATNKFVYIYVPTGKSPKRRKKEVLNILSGTKRVSSGELFRIPAEWEPLTGVPAEQLVFEAYKHTGKTV
jgi:hypothetical protein